MDLKLIHLTIFGTLSLGCCFWLTAPVHGTSIFLGALWGSANLFLIQLIARTFIAEKKRSAKRLLLLLLKCPFLYFAGYALLKLPTLSPLHLVLGFSLLFFCLLVITMVSMLKKVFS